MTKASKLYGILGVCLAIVPAMDAVSSERLLVADVNARAEYNDNIFLTDQAHDSVTGIIITPSLYGQIKEKNWSAKLDAMIRSNSYSDSSLDSNDQFLDFIGSYRIERNIFSLNMNYDLDSNLSSTSTDFGISGRRVNRKSQGVTPQYTRLITERLSLVLSYSHLDVDYLESGNTGYTPYISKSASGSLIYSLTERDKLTLRLQGVDYTSKNDLITYKMFISRVGIEHDISETLSVDFLVGVSRRYSTNLDTNSFEFFGQTITRTREIDSSDRGLVLDAGITKMFETAELTGRLSRDNTTNSFGGLNQVDRFTIDLYDTVTSLWRYNLNARYEDITAISTAAGNADRNVLLFESIAYYSFRKDWNLNASYRYVQRRFKNDLSGSRAPHSNRIYLGLTYNFPPLSTY